MLGNFSHSLPPSCSVSRLFTSSSAQWRPFCCVLRGQLWPWRGPLSHPRDRGSKTFTNESERVCVGSAARREARLQHDARRYDATRLVAVRCMWQVVSFWVNNFGDRLNLHQAASDARPVNIVVGKFYQKNNNKKKETVKRNGNG